MAPTTSPASTAPLTDGPSLGDPSCDVCPHGVSHHDAIGLRFCRATLVGAITRGCICRPS
ncbi:RGCVC family protein [Geodermatophilus maliterrae]|uniref:RGCVC family protein n=1 Tax=Geodermatophilus maliterrae TaxID=3162531 RepID=A0ABV3XFN8_9ACTN